MLDFGYIIMTLFEMKASHLYLFEVDELENFENRIKARGQNIELFSGVMDMLKVAQYGCIFEDDDIIPNQDKRYKKLEDAKDVKLKHIIYEENDCLKFHYDFGDNWWITIRLEKVFESEEISGKDLPRVIEGEGFGIIEDCGGTMGLEDVRDAFSQKQGGDYKMYCDWLGVTDLDMYKCDLEDLNFRLKKLPRIFRDCYEYNLEPSRQSMKILDRDY